MVESSAALLSPPSPAWPVPEAVPSQGQATGAEPRPTASYINLTWSNRHACPTALLEEDVLMSPASEWLMRLLKKGQLFCLPKTSLHLLEKLCKLRAYCTLCTRTL